MFEYLAQVQSAVRRINYRLETLSKHFGNDNPIVSNYQSQLDVLFPDNYRLKDGTPQLTMPSEIYKNSELNETLESFEGQVASWGDYKSQYENSYNKYTSEQEFFKEDTINIEDFITTMENLDTVFTKYESSQFPDEALEILTRQHKSYNDLNKVSAILKEKGLL